MDEATRASGKRDESPGTDVYLPAVSLPPRFETVKRQFTRLFGRHDMVPIPRTYNR